jgi:hypothetical protein
MTVIVTTVVRNCNRKRFLATQISIRYFYGKIESKISVGMVDNAINEPLGLFALSLIQEEQCSRLVNITVDMQLVGLLEIHQALPRGLAKGRRYDFNGVEFVFKPEESSLDCRYLLSCCTELQRVPCNGFQRCNRTHHGGLGNDDVGDEMDFVVGWGNKSTEKFSRR